MKKLLLMVVACFVALAANAWSVKFTNPNNWANVNVYAWDNGYSGKAGSWPGTAMTKQADGTYSFEESGTAIPGKIIFNNGSSQTGDLTFGAANDGKTYNFYGPEDAILNEYKIYFDNSTAKWSKVYLYGWNGVATAPWPGDQVTTTDDRGYYVYTFKGETAPTGGNIIWNNGDNVQTANLNWETDAVYDQNGPVNAKEETYTVYLNNTAGWSNVYVYTFNPELAGSWPGTEIQKNDAGLYVWNYTSKVAPACEGIIFNDGGSNQTADLTYTVGETYTNGDGSAEVWVNLNGDFHPEGDNGVQPVDGIATWTNQAIGDYPVYLKVWDGEDKYYFAESAVALNTWTTLTYSAEGQPTYIVGQTADCVYNVEYNVANNQIKFTLVSGGSDQPGDTTLPAVVYLMGDVNGGTWAANVGIPASGNEGVYEWNNVSVGSGDSYINFASVLGANENDWNNGPNSANRYGATESNTPIEAGMTYDVKVFARGSEAGLCFSWMPSEGEYDLVLDLNALTLTVNEAGYTDGVANIGVDATAPVYYNLQGVKVANPENGLYIKVVNGKATKTIVRK